MEQPEAGRRFQSQEHERKGCQKEEQNGSGGSFEDKPLRNGWEKALGPPRNAYAITDPAEPAAAGPILPRIPGLYFTVF